MKKRIKTLLPLLAFPLIVSGCSFGNNLDDFNSKNIDGNVNHFDFQGNFIQPELTIDGRDDEPEWRGENVSEELTFTSGRNQITVKLFRGSESLFVFFNVYDKNLCAVGNNNGDDVSLSDSVEVYIDSKNDGGLKPQSDDYQINLGVNGKTRMLVGTGTVWTNWNGLCQYEVVLKGTFNNNDDTDVGYSVEAMIPWNQIGCSKDSEIGVAFGCVNKKSDDVRDFDWGGVVFDGVLAEPQTPNNFFTYSGNTFVNRPFVTREINFSTLVVDEIGNPLKEASVKYNNNTYATDINGVAQLGKVNQTDNVDLEISKDGYKTLKYTVKSSDIVYKGGDYTYEATLKEGSGVDEVTHSFVEVGETFEKTVFIKKFERAVISVSKADPLGVTLQLVTDGSQFDEEQTYEIYIDTGLRDRTVTDLSTWCIKFCKDAITSVVKDPKGNLTKMNAVYANAKCAGNSAEIYIPYSLLEISKSSGFAVSFGIWDSLVEDWSPMSRNSMECRVEDPSHYVFVNADGTITDNVTKAGDYDPLTDFRNYIDLGSFSGKAFGADKFSKIGVEAFHGNDKFFIRFTTDQDMWRSSERIELYMDVGNASRTSRDADTYQAIIYTGQGIIYSFNSYGTTPRAVSLEGINVFKNDTQMVIEVPYSALNTNSEATIGLSFGLFNMVADDFDGYAYNTVYIDPEKPNLFIRVSKDNTIE